jgi:hypothetical protein
MSRPEADRRRGLGLRARPACCAELAGASPAAVSAVAPRSRPQVGGEIPQPERGVESPTWRPYGLAWGSKSAGPMRKREPLQPRDRSNRKGEVAEPVMSRRRQQTASVSDGGTQDISGVRRGARRYSPARNWRDPPRLPHEGEGGSYKPSAKGSRAGRESEGVVVPSMARTTTSPEGRAPTLIAPRVAGTCEGMAPAGAQLPLRKSTTPVERALHRRQVSFGPAPGEVAREVRRSSVSRVREIRMHGLTGGRRRRGLTGHRA